ncbi:hypothetical protein [Candidatus Chlorohelix sp.]
MRPRWVGANLMEMGQGSGRSGSVGATSVLRQDAPSLGHIM